MTKWWSYLAKVTSTRRAHPEWREGQTYFNVLEEMEPVLAAEVRITDVDPFFDDGRVDAFRQWVSERLP